MVIRHSGQKSNRGVLSQHSRVKGWRRIRHIMGVVLGSFLLGSVLWVLVLKFVPVYLTPLMLIRSMEAHMNGAKEWHWEQYWVPLKQISPNMSRAVIASEDNLFLEHYGFSKRGIEQAWKERKNGRVRHGGSTISQQTAKNVFCTNQRTFVRKGFEAYFTVLIELIWGKERIMEVYLNVIEMGDGIFGVQAASQKYYHKDAANLSKQQAASIAVCLPNPRKMHPDKPSSYVLKRENQILCLMPKVKGMKHID